jgi:hypothetical protein
MVVRSKGVRSPARKFIALRKMSIVKRAPFIQVIQPRRSGTVKTLTADVGIGFLMINPS